MALTSLERHLMIGCYMNNPKIPPGSPIIPKRPLGSPIIPRTTYPKHTNLTGRILSVAMCHEEPHGHLKYSSWIQVYPGA